MEGRDHVHMEGWGHVHMEMGVVISHSIGRDLEGCYQSIWLVSVATWIVWRICSIRVCVGVAMCGGDLTDLALVGHKLKDEVDDEMHTLLHAAACGG